MPTDVDRIQPQVKKGILPIAPFKEYAGVLTAFIVVIAYVSIGFLAMSAEVFLGIKVVPPGDWSSALLSLSSAAMGYLIGKQMTPSDNTTITTTNKSVDSSDNS